jgi:hypothetical protein
VQYDKVPDGQTSNTHYAEAEDVAAMVGSGQWQRTTIRLPDARFGNGQNFSADLRLCGPEVAIRRIELAFTAPANYTPGGINPALLDALTNACVAGRYAGARITEREVPAPPPAQPQPERENSWIKPSGGRPNGTPRRGSWLRG